jgi:hypothetical protein
LPRCFFIHGTLAGQFQEKGSGKPIRDGCQEAHEARRDATGSWTSPVSERGSGRTENIFLELTRFEVLPGRRVLESPFHACRCGSRCPIWALIGLISPDSMQAAPSACGRRSPVTCRGLSRLHGQCVPWPAMGTGRGPENTDRSCVYASTPITETSSSGRFCCYWHTEAMPIASSRLAPRYQ